MRPHSIDETAALLGSADYVAGRRLATAVFLALELGRPLFLEGEAGVGKTEVAKALAQALGRDLIRLQCYEGLDVSSAYLVKRPILRALEPGANGDPPVLLIDEIDRADEPFEAYLLEVLSDYQVTIPELGAVKAAEPPIVVVTSNRTREIHDAIKRRCLYHWVDYPDAQAELEIVRRKAPGAAERLSREVVAFVQRLREKDLFKAPGVAETLDWTRALTALDAVALDAATLDDTLGVLLKYQEDVARLRGGEGAAILEEARSRVAA